MNPEEASLIERIRGGEPALFLELIRPYERSLFLLACSVLKNEADAEDVAQETVLKTFEHLDQLRSAHSFKSWFFQIGMNQARQRCREKRDQLHRYLDAGTEISEDGDVVPCQLVDWRDIPSELLYKREVREQLNKALYDLPDSYREVFVLRTALHHSEKEAAEVLGISVTAVRARLHRARLKLRERLTPIFKRRWHDRLLLVQGARAC